MDRRFTAWLSRPERGGRWGPRWEGRVPGPWVVTESEPLRRRAFTTLCYSADGQSVLAGGMSRFVCIYHVREQILRKKFEISCNLSLDAMEVSEQWGPRPRLWASQARGGAGQGWGLSARGGQLAAPPACSGESALGVSRRRVLPPCPSTVESEDPTPRCRQGLLAQLRP